MKIYEIAASWDRDGSSKSPTPETHGNPGHLMKSFNKFMHVCECVCVKESVRIDSIRISIKHTTHIAMGCWHPSGLHERSARAVHPMEGS